MEFLKTVAGMLGSWLMVAAAAWVVMKVTKCRFFDAVVIVAMMITGVLIVMAGVMIVRQWL